MRKNIKKTFAYIGNFILIVMLGLSLWSVVQYPNAVKKIKIKKDYIHTQYAYDFNDAKYISKRLDNAEYIFIGEVVSYKDTVYYDKYTFANSEKQKKTVYNTYTEYNVKLEKDLKNNLGEKEEVIVSKLGGVSEDGKTVNVVEGDQLLKTGNKYLFIASGSKNKYFVCGCYSTYNIDSKYIFENIDQIQNYIINIKK